MDAESPQELTEQRLLPRHMEHPVRASLEEFRAVAVVGARQIGKSTLAQSLVVADFPAEILTLDDAPTRSAALEDPDGLIARLSKPAIIDEVQRAPDLMLAIKAQLDRDDSRGQFLLTGSADLLTLRSIRDALPGRVVYLQLWPLSQAEILGLAPSSFLEQAFAGEIGLAEVPERGRSAYAQQIVTGGYPEALRLTAAGRDRYFTSYIDSLIARELDAVGALRDHAALRGLLSLVAARSTQLTNYSALGSELGIDQKTSKHYANVLGQLFLTFTLPPWSANLGHRLTKSSKLMIRDTGLMAHLAGADAARLAEELSGNFAGMFFETFAISEIARQCDLSAVRPSLYHYRDKSQREVDLILERRNGDVVAIEVKATISVGPDDFAALRFLRDRLGDRLKAGIVLYTGDRTLPFGPRLQAVPLSALWRSSASQVK